MGQLLQYLLAEIETNACGFLVQPAIIPGKAALKDAGKILGPDAYSRILYYQSGLLFGFFKAYGD